MTTLHDRDTDTHIKHKGKAGAAHAILTDKSGTPIDSGNPLPITTAGVGSTSSVTGSDGTLLELDALAQTLNYNGDGTLNYIQVTHPTNTFSYRQTFGYTSGALTSITGWVKQ